MQISKEQRSSKLRSVAVEAIFVGYDLQSTCYLFDLKDKRVIKRRDAVFMDKRNGNPKSVGVAELNVNYKRMRVSERATNSVSRQRHIEVCHLVKAAHDRG